MTSPPSGATLFRILPAMVVGTVAGLLTGCPNPDTGPAEQARATVATLLESCARGNGEAVLDLVTPPTREVVIASDSVAAGCDRLLGLQTESEVAGPTVLRDTTVKSVAVEGGFGTATVATSDGVTSELDLELTKGRWKITNPPL